MVKGSGGDIGSIKMDGFATLYMDKLQELKSIYQGVEYEDEMVNHLLHCIFNLNPRAASIDTPLHAYVPHKHVDHVHADAIIRSQHLKTQKRLLKRFLAITLAGCLGSAQDLSWVYGLKKFCLENPDSHGVILESHGLFTWGNTAKACYDTTIYIINVANTWLHTKIQNVEVFGGAKHDSLPRLKRHDTAAKLMPQIRGFVSSNQYMVGHFNDSDEVLEFVNSANMKPLAALGTSCPDHFLRTKIRPLVINFNPAANNIEEVLENLPKQINGVSSRLQSILQSL